MRFRSLRGGTMQRLCQPAESNATGACAPANPFNRHRAPIKPMKKKSDAERFVTATRRGLTNFVRVGPGSASAGHPRRSVGTRTAQHAPRRFLLRRIQQSLQKLAGLTARRIVGRQAFLRLAQRTDPQLNLHQPEIM